MDAKPKFDYEIKVILVLWLQIFTFKKKKCFYDDAGAHEFNEAIETNVKGERETSCRFLLNWIKWCCFFSLILVVSLDFRFYFKLNGVVVLFSILNLYFNRIVSSLFSLGKYV